MAYHTGRFCKACPRELHTNNIHGYCIQCRKTRWCRLCSSMVDDGRTTQGWCLACQAGFRAVRQRLKERSPDVRERV